MVNGLLAKWAGAWRFGVGNGGVDFLPAPAAWFIFGGLVVTAIVWSIIVGSRSASFGIHGESKLQGALYGNPG